MNDREELLGRARELRPMLASHAAEAEATGRIRPEVIEAVRDAGLLRLTVPRRFGGYQLPFRSVVEVCAAVAEGCGSTGWITGFANTGKWMASLWSAHAQQEIFSVGPDAIHAGTSKPATDVTAVDGGYRISGTFPSMSGLPYATWAGLFLLIPGADGEPPAMAEALVHATELTVENTWDVAGLRATGSETAVAKDVFVPAHRVIDVTRLQTSDFRQYPTPYKDEALYRAAVHPVLALVVAMTPVGLASGALDLAVNGAGQRSLSGTTYKLQRDSVSFGNEIADAAMLADTARLHMYRAATDLDSFAERAEPMDPVTRARVRADTGWAVKSATECIDKIITAVGSGAFANASPFQRMWRDANVAARHGAASYMLNRELYGKALLGVDTSFNRLAV
jgi:3-hydroxy-9,10-secoandrosta-1,3,5(10)-triene-9,17-dione monooxygenase